MLAEDLDDEETYNHDGMATDDPLDPPPDVLAAEDEHLYRALFDHLEEDGGSEDPGGDRDGEGHGMVLDQNDETEFAAPKRRLLKRKSPPKEAAGRDEGHQSMMLKRELTQRGVEKRKHPVEVQVEPDLGVTKLTTDAPTLSRPGFLSLMQLLGPGGR